MRRVYRLMLRLYPYDYRAAFEPEMLESFQKTDHPAAMEICGLIRGAVMEWFAKLTTDAALRGRRLPDVRMMRPAGMPRELWFGQTKCSSDTSR